MSERSRIDLMTTCNDGKYTAIQCKVYAPDHQVNKGDIDSFMNASGKSAYSERLIFETSEVPWSKEVVATMTEGLAKANRRKLIMVCGTSKTLTGLRVAERLTREVVRDQPGITLASCP